MKMNEDLSVDITVYAVISIINFMRTKHYHVFFTLMRNSFSIPIIIHLMFVGLLLFQSQSYTNFIKL